MRVYDKIKWHGKGSAAEVFLGWAATRELLGDDIEPVDARAAKAGKLGAGALLARYGGVLTSDMLSTEGQKLAEAWLAAGTAAMPKTRRAMDAELAAWRAGSKGKKTTSKTASSPLLEARLTRLRARAKRRHAVEVEHLVAFARLGDPAAAAPLRELAATHQWPRSGRGVVPLGAWVDAIAALLEQGVGALARQAKSKKLSPFIVVALLEEIPTHESTAALLELAKRADKEGDAELLAVSLGGLNTVFVGDPSFDATGSHARTARALVHRILKRKLSSREAFDCYCVLQLVGDESSLALIASRPPLTGDYKGEEAVAMRVLKRALASRG